MASSSFVLFLQPHVLGVGHPQMQLYRGISTSVLLQKFHYKTSFELGSSGLEIHVTNVTTVLSEATASDGVSRSIDIENSVLLQ